MDNQKNPEQPRDDSWLDEILGPQDTGSEIGPDELAVSSAGLTDPVDLELEQLLAEFSAEAAGSENQTSQEAASPAPIQEEPIISANPTDAEAPFRDEEFRAAFGEGQELEQVFAAPVQETPAEPEPQVAEEAPQEPAKKKKRRKKEAPQKRRPGHKKGYGFFGIPHLLATCVWLGLAVVIGATVGNVLWMLGADVLAFNQDPHTVTITIDEEDTIDDIALLLQEEELIRYPELFKFFAELTGKVEDISPGTYTLNAPDEEGNIPGIAYDYNALLNSMKQYAPARQTVDVVVPEGYNCAEIFALMEEKGVCTAAELEEWAANGELNEYWFLEGVERGDKYCLEGYLFPDTYEFYLNDEPQQVLHKLLNAFDNRFTDKMREDLAAINDIYAEMMRDEGYGEEYIAEHTIGIREIVIIASMIEKESPGPDESYTISSVIYNRLSDPDFPTLGIDATVIYANLLATGITENIDYEIDSPYNTYVYGGLPIGPIANPGQQSLNAALNPEDTNYYYYALYADSRQHGFFTNSKDFEDFLWEQGYYDEE